MQDTKTDARTGIPFLKDLPYIGQFFRRDQVTTTKTDLLIFLTARLVRQDEFSAEKISKAEKSVGIEKSVQKESATESEEKKKQ